MYDLFPEGLAGIVPALTTLYWICLVVGGGLLVISSVAGGHADTDFSSDVHVGGDLPVDAHAGADFDSPTDATGHAHADHAGAASLASWFSIQFVVFFMAMFGVIGVTLTHLTEAGGGATLIASVGGGLIVGQGVHQLLRKLRASSGNSTTQLADYVDKPARVTIDMTDRDRGEVAVRVGGGERFIPAVSKREDAKFERGDQVTVVDYQGGVASVVSREEFDFLTHKD